MFEEKNNIKNKKYECERLIRKMNDLKKDNFKIFQLIKNEQDLNKKIELKKDYIRINQKIHPQIYII